MKRFEGSELPLGRAEAARFRTPGSKRSQALLLLILIGFPTPSLLAQEQRLSLERLYSLPWLIGTAPRGVSWSPDSQRISFLWNDEGRNFRDVWVLQEGLQQPQRVTRLATPDTAELDRGVSWAAWGPNSRMLVYLFRGKLFAVEDGTIRQLTGLDGFSGPAAHSRLPAIVARRQGDLWWVPLQSGEEPRQLTRQAGDVRGVNNFQWSQDGRLLAVLVGDRIGVRERLVPDYLQEETGTGVVRRPYPGERTEHRRLGIVDVDSGTWRELDLPGDPQEPVWSYHFSPDSRQLLVDKSDFYVKDRRLLVYPDGATEPQTWYREQDARNVTPDWQAEWSPDGGIYFISDVSGAYQVHHLASPGTQPRQVTRGNGEVASFSPSPDGRWIFFVANFDDPEQRNIYRVASDGSGQVRLSNRAGTHTPIFAPDTSRAAVLFSSDDTPTDLFLNRLDPSSAEPERQLTGSPREEFRRYRWVQPRYVRFRSHVDGVELHGRLTLPPDFDPGKKYPAILGSVYANTVRNQWGGRTAHPTWGLDQLLVQEGYVLLNVNMRGSWGHGRDFRQGLYQGYGGIDVEDLYSGVQFLLSEGYVDAERIGIWGSSYGGLMTCMSLFKKPGVYAAGIAGAPATNVWHAFPEQMWVMMQPSLYPEKFRASSAYHQASGLEDPLMIIHGMRDAVVFYQDTLRLVDRLIEEGKDVDLVTLPNAGHGWDNEGLAQTRFAFRKMLEFFDRHLKPETR